MMDFMNLFGGGNPAQGMRMPTTGQGLDLYGGQPTSNLGMTMPGPNYGDGTGLKPPSSFGQMPTGMPKMDMQLAKMLLNESRTQAAPMQQMQQVQLPSGANQSYDQLMKMYGVRGLLG